MIDFYENENFDRFVYTVEEAALWLQEAQGCE